ncbi:MAG: SURF1 family protein [Acidimicrobiales bacterium]
MEWRFLREPKWLIRHVAVVALVVAMVAAGFWQLRRHDDKRTYKALVEDRQEQPAAPVGALLDVDSAVDATAVDDVLYRTVTASGTYLDDDTVVVENRTLNGSSGAWVLTPLVLDDGNAVVVNRGFIGFDRQGDIVAPPAPEGPVAVEGLLFPSQTRGRFGPTDPADGDLDVLARVDLDRYEAQLDVALLPAYVQAVTTTPAEAAPPEGEPQLVALGPPEPDLGPHLAYAAQWFIFTTIAAGGYGLLLRKVAAERARAGRPPAAGDPLDDELAELLRTRP